MFLIKRDGEPITLIRETDDRSAGALLLRWFHTHHGYSMDHAIRHEGYSFEEVIGLGSLPFTGDLHTLTCVNHPHLRWATKGRDRSFFFLPDNGAMHECPCPGTDLYRIED